MTTPIPPIVANLGYCLGKAVFSSYANVPIVTIIAPSVCEEHTVQPAQDVTIYGQENIELTVKFLLDVLEKAAQKQPNPPTP